MTGQSPTDPIAVLQSLIAAWNHGQAAGAMPHPPTDPTPHLATAMTDLAERLAQIEARLARLEARAACKDEKRRRRKAKRG